MFEKPEYKNFEPSNELEKYADAVVSHLIDMAPQDAAANSVVTRHGVMYSCRVEIMSKVGAFKTHIIAKNPKTALQQAHRKVMNQLLRWQRSRSTFPSWVPA